LARILAFSESFSPQLYPMVGRVRVTEFRKLQSVQHSVQHFVGTVKASKGCLQPLVPFGTHGPGATQQR
jgi:hypothetical protein